MKLSSSIKQWKFPPEFRINAIDAVPEAKLGQTIQDLQDLIKNPKDQLPVDLIKDIGTSAWRLRKKLPKLEVGQPMEKELRSAYRQVENLWDAMSEAGIQILDHTGETLPEYGESKLKILAFQSTPGITQEKIQETVKPSIIYNNVMIQMGEVIVSKPEGEEQHEQNNH